MTHNIDTEETIDRSAGNAVGKAVGKAVGNASGRTSDSPGISDAQALDDIQTIRKFLEAGQSCLEDTGVVFMLWGILIPVLTVLFYLGGYLLGFDHVVTRSIWQTGGTFGAVASISLGRIASSGRSGSSFASRLNTRLWIGYLVTLGVFVFMLAAGGIEPTPILLSFIAALLGLAYWLYGALSGTVWFSRLGFVWWSDAVVFSLLDWPAASVLMAVTTFCCSFIPGLILYRKRITGGA